MNCLSKEIRKIIPLAIMNKNKTLNNKLSKGGKVKTHTEHS